MKSEKNFNNLDANYDGKDITFDDKIILLGNIIKYNITQYIRK